MIKSEIDGEFRGCFGDTLFKLSNGQIWQQIKFAYIQHYAYRPKVLVYPGGKDHIMQIEGLGDRIEVKLIE